MSHRTLFLSDIHLGTKGCRAELLLEFLAQNDAETIYLIGDIFDGWRLKRGWHWPQSHNDVVQAFLDKASKGTKIIYIPGNHDEVMRSYLGTHFGGIDVQRTADFTSAAGQRYLVTHGDQFDTVVMNHKWIAYLGDRAYGFLLTLNSPINRLRGLWGGQYWSLSKWSKQQVKQAVSFISRYEDVLTDEARRGGYDGVICGHIHHANMRDINGVHYINTGDWVESCTAVIEGQDGEIKLHDLEAIAARKRKLARRMARKRRAEQRETERNAA